MRLLKTILYYITVAASALFIALLPSFSVVEIDINLEALEQLQTIIGWRHQL